MPSAGCRGEPGAGASRVRVRVEHLEQYARVGYELRRLSYHLVDRLMGRRNLVEERLGEAIFDAHSPSIPLVKEGLASRTPRVGPGGHPERGQGEGR